MFDLNEMRDFYKMRPCDPRELEANLYIETAYDIDNYIEVTRDIIEYINWDNYIATIGTLYGKPHTVDVCKVKILCIQHVRQLFPAFQQPHLGDQLNVSYIAPAKFMVRSMAFWEYYDKFPRVIKNLTDDGCVDENTKFYIHKNYIHVFKSEEAKI